jgi:aminopeptidase N
VRFTEENVHDFAWFTDKRYHILQSEVELPNSKRKVKSWVYFRNDQADVWLKANDYINDALYYYSRWYGDYPYNNCTAISVPRGARGGGMEYPTITAIGYNKRDIPLEMVIMHEVGHNWFYGILGFNERRYPVVR